MQSLLLASALVTFFGTSVEGFLNPRGVVFPPTTLGQYQQNYYYTPYINGQPAYNAPVFNGYTPQPAYNGYGSRNVAVRLCFDNLAVHSSDSDNLMDQHEEWNMRMGLLATTGSPIQSLEIKVPVKLSGANFMSTVGQCQTYPMTIEEARQLVVYTDGFEKDSPPLNPNDPLPGGQTVLNLNGGVQRFAVRAADAKHAYTAYGRISLAP
jgi:hypothetical protein